ncbi:hypothetical protein GCM10010109_77310 [Actinoplanes campanulatus]|nr:hypothetical protein GCM10010109_77310 [Actinoplanes campanulatus]GID40959.1 hypothetical protein Aca09nite_74650 [Actinoplanes campanulatus]
MTRCIGTTGFTTRKSTRPGCIGRDILPGMFTRFRPMTAIALVACLLGGCTEDRNEPGHVRCTEHEEERVAVLAQLPILDAHDRPAGMYRRDIRW